MAEIQHGWLIIADISGYTAFLARNDLSRAQGIIERLMGPLVEGLSARMNLVKLEGDAVFVSAPDALDLDPQRIINLLEDCYYAFRMTLVDLDVTCVGAPDLDLKFAVHHGKYMIQRLGGTEDLAGRDVILVHRLLKNTVRERLGHGGYLIASAAAHERLPAAEWDEHEEHYEHLGTTRVAVRDLHPVFDEMQATDPTAVPAEGALLDLTYTVPASAARAWDWHIEDGKRDRWEATAERWRVIPDATGRVRRGTRMECEHADGSSTLFEITGWRPYTGLTMRIAPQGWVPSVRLTYLFEALGPNETRVTLRMSRPERWLPRQAARVMAFVLRRALRQSLPTLTRLVGETAALPTPNPALSGPMEPLPASSPG